MVGIALCGMGGLPQAWAEAPAGAPAAPSPTPAPGAAAAAASPHAGEGGKTPETPPANEADGANEPDDAQTPAAPKTASWSSLPAATAADLEIDFPLLLGDAKSLSNTSFQDPVWVLAPNKAARDKTGLKAPPTMRLVAIPIRICGSKGFKVADPPVGPTDGRFIAWFIPRPAETATPPKVKAVVAADQKPIDKVQAKPADKSDTKPEDKVQAKPADKSDTKPDGADAPPPGASHFAASFAVTPDGRIHWGVDRFASTMNLVSGISLTDERTFYAMTFARSKFKALAPPPYAGLPPQAPVPPRASDEPLQYYMNRKEKAAAEYKAKVVSERKKYDDKVALFRGVQDKIGSLPEQFAVKAPPVVYALYYVRDSGTKPGKVYAGYATVKAGPDRVFAGFPQGPWVVSDQAWSLLAGFSASAIKSPPKPSAEQAAKDPVKAAAAEADYKAHQEKIGLIAAMLDSKHPAAFKAAAVAVANSGMLNDLEIDSPAFKLAEKVMSGGDVWAREKVMKSLMAASVSTGKAILMGKAAAQSGDSGVNRDMQIAALQIMLHSKEADTDAKRVAILLQALSDPQGVPPADALAQWLKLQEGEVWARDSRIARGEVPLDVLAKDLLLAFKPLDITSDTRRRQTLAAVLAASGNSSLAGILADKCLFGTSPALSMEVLDVMGSMVDGKETLSVPLYAPSHQIFKQLSSADKAVRDKAWKVLPLFEVRPLFKMTAVSASNPAKQAEAAAQREVLFKQLAGEPGGQKPTPPELAPFLARQAERDGCRTAALSALIQVLAAGDPAASKQAADFLTGPGLAPSLMAALLSSGPDLRVKAVAGFYAAKQLPMPAPAGAGMDEQLSDALTRWFAGSLSKGLLPSAELWAAQVPEDAPLIDWIMGQEPLLSRCGVAVLAYREGADDATVAATITRMLAKPHKLRAQVERDWAECQTDIFMGRVKNTDGHYMVRMATFARGDAAWREAAPSHVTMKWVDNVLSLGVQGVSMSPVAAQKVLELSDVALLDRINSKMRRELNLGGTSGAVQFSWKPPYWEAELHPDADHVTLIRFGPEGPAQKLDIPLLAGSSKDPADAPAKPPAKKK